METIAEVNLSLSALTKTAPINLSMAGESIVVAAVDGESVIGFSYHLVCAQAVTLKWKSGVHDVSGLMSFGANGGIVVGFAPNGVLKTGIGEPLILSSSADVVVGGIVSYVYIGN